MLAVVEAGEQVFDVSLFEVIAGHFHLVLVEHIAIGHLARRPIRPHQIVNAVYALQVHRNTLDAVSNFAGDRIALKTTRLLKVGELRHFHAVQPDLPA